MVAPPSNGSVVLLRRGESRVASSRSSQIAFKFDELRKDGVPSATWNIGRQYSV